MPEYDSLFGEYKTENLPQFLFNTIFMMRRMAYCCIIIVLPFYPLMQAFTFMLICIPVFVYHIIMNPYRDLWNNVVMNINEAMLLVVGTFFYVFSEPMEDDDKSALIGWTVIGVILSVMCANIALIWALKIVTVRRELIEWWETRKNKKNKGPNDSLSQFKSSHRDHQNSSQTVNTNSVLHRHNLVPSQFLTMTSNMNRQLGVNSGVSQN